MTQQFDEFADKHPDSQCAHCPPVYIAIEGLGCFVTQIDEKTVAEESWGREGNGEGQGVLAWDQRATLDGGRSHVMGESVDVSHLAAGLLLI